MLSSLLTKFVSPTSLSSLFGSLFLGGAFLVWLLWSWGRGAKKCVGLTWKPWDEVRGLTQDDGETLVVDCSHPALLMLSHHKAGAGPLRDALAGDSSTDLVINCILATTAGTKLPCRSPFQNRRYVSCNHFDVDAVTSAWCAMHPHKVAQDQRIQALLRATARIGDFRTLHAEAVLDSDGLLPAEERELECMALRLCCWLNSEEKRLFRRPFERSQEKMTPGSDKMVHFLPLLEQMLEPAGLQAVSKRWRDEYDLVLKHCQQIWSDQTAMRRYPELGLLVVQTPAPVHYYSLFSATHGFDIVLALYAGQKYELEIKYSTYIDMYSRSCLPRVNLATLAKHLTWLEQSLNPAQGRFWVTDRIVDSGPLMYLGDPHSKLGKVERYAHPYERPMHASSLSPSEMESHVVSYLKHALGGAGRQVGWTWAQLHEFNRTIAWDEWRCGGAGATCPQPANSSSSSSSNSRKTNSSNSGCGGGECGTGADDIEHSRLGEAIVTEGGSSRAGQAGDSAASRAACQGCHMSE